MGGWSTTYAAVNYWMKEDKSLKKESVMDVEIHINIGYPGSIILAIRWENDTIRRMEKPSYN